MIIDNASGSDGVGNLNLCYYQFTVAIFPKQKQSKFEKNSDDEKEGNDGCIIF